MSVPAWFWPPSGLAARASSLLTFSGGLAVADWTTPRLFPFGVDGFGAPVVLDPTGLGIAAAVADGFDGAWAVSYDGRTWGVTDYLSMSSGRVSASGVYVGAAFVAASGFAMGSDGRVWKMSTPGGSLHGAWPGPARSMASSGTTLLGLLPASGLLGTMGVPFVATGSVALPAGVAAPSCVAASGGAVVVGGWNYSSPLSGAADAALDPQNPLVMLAVGSGFARTWVTSGALTENWVQGQAVTGLASLTRLSWIPNGTQVLACAPGSGAVQVLGYSAGVLSLLQTLAVSGACGVAVAADSGHALVAQSGLSQAMPLTVSGVTWSAGSPVTGLAGISSIAAYGDAGAVAAVSGGVAILGLIAGTWTLIQTVALGFAPTVVGVDPFQNVYAAGSGMIAMLSSGAVVANGAWTGAAPTDMAVQQGRAVLAIPSDGLLRVFGNTAPGYMSQQYFASMSLGTPVGLALSDTTLFSMGSGSTVTYGFSGSQYALTQTTNGYVARWDGSSWTSTLLGIGHNPSAVGFDASGRTLVVTEQNTAWTVTSGGSAVSSGLVTVPPGQVQTAPIGASAVQASGSAVYVATSLAGVLVEIA